MPSDPVPGIGHTVVQNRKPPRRFEFYPSSAIPVYTGLGPRRPSVCRTGGLGPTFGLAVREGELWMACKLLRHCCVTAANSCKQWWAMVYDIKNCELRTSLQSVVAVRLDSEMVHLAKQKWGSPRTTPLALCTFRPVGLLAPTHFPLDQQSGISSFQTVIPDGRPSLIRAPDSVSAL
jgi:hypothetical protein